MNAIIAWILIIVGVIAILGTFQDATEGLIKVPSEGESNLAAVFGIIAICIGVWMLI